MLATEGPDAVRIDRIAARLRLTKGSFHHHFQGFAGYRNALLERIESDNRALLLRLEGEAVDVDPLEAIRGLAPRVDRLLDRGLERGLRAWAVTDDAVSEVLERVDSARLDHLTGHWVKVLGPDAGGIAALLPHLVLIGASATYPPIDRDRLGEVMALMARMVPLVSAELGASGKHERVEDTRL